MQRTFPEDMKEEVRSRFPGWSDMHRWLNEGHCCVSTYLNINARDLYEKWKHLWEG